MFTISQFAGQDRMDVEVVGGRRLAILSGTGVFTFKGNGGDWRRDRASIDLGPFPQTVARVVPFASLASVANDQTAMQAGWAVDRVSAHMDPNTKHLVLEADLAVRDVDGYIYRLNYLVHVLY